MANDLLVAILGATHTQPIWKKEGVFVLSSPVAAPDGATTAQVVTEALEMPAGLHFSDRRVVHLFNVHGKDHVGSIQGVALTNAACTINKNCAIGELEISGRPVHANAYIASGGTIASLYYPGGLLAQEQYPLIHEEYGAQVTYEQGGLGPSAVEVLIAPGTITNEHGLYEPAEPVYGAAVFSGGTLRAEPTTVVGQTYYSAPFIAYSGGTIEVTGGTEGPCAYYPNENGKLLSNYGQVIEARNGGVILGGTAGNILARSGGYVSLQEASGMLAVEAGGTVSVSNNTKVSAVYIRISGAEYPSITLANTIAMQESAGIVDSLGVNQIGPYDSGLKTWPGEHSVYERETWENGDPPGEVINRDVPLELPAVKKIIGTTYMSAHIVENPVSVAMFRGGEVTLENIGNAYDVDKRGTAYIGNYIQGGAKLFWEAPEMGAPHVTITGSCYIPEGAVVLYTELHSASEEHVSGWERAGIPNVHKFTDTVVRLEESEVPYNLYVDATTDTIIPSGISVVGASVSWLYRSLNHAVGEYGTIMSKAIMRSTYPISKGTVAVINRVQGKHIIEEAIDNTAVALRIGNNCVALGTGLSARTIYVESGGTLAPTYEDPTKDPILTSVVYRPAESEYKYTSTRAANVWVTHSAVISSGGLYTPKYPEYGYVISRYVLDRYDVPDYALQAGIDRHSIGRYTTFVACSGAHATILNDDRQEGTLYIAGGASVTSGYISYAYVLPCGVYAQPSLGSNTMYIYNGATVSDIVQHEPGGFVTLAAGAVCSGGVLSGAAGGRATVSLQSGATLKDCNINNVYVSADAGATLMDCRLTSLYRASDMDAGVIIHGGHIADTTDISANITSAHIDGGFHGLDVHQNNTYVDCNIGDAEPIPGRYVGSFNNCVLSHVRFSKYPDLVFDSSWLRSVTFAGGRIVLGDAVSGLGVDALYSATVLVSSGGTHENLKIVCRGTISLGSDAMINAVTVHNGGVCELKEGAHINSLQLGPGASAIGTVNGKQIQGYDLKRYGLVDIYEGDIE